MEEKKKYLVIFEGKQIRRHWDDQSGKSGVKEGLEFAILTDEITKAWTGMTTREYKNLKGLKKDNFSSVREELIGVILNNKNGEQVRAQMIQSLPKMYYGVLCRK